MTEPKEAARPTRIQERLKLEDVPPDKWRKMTEGSWAGFIFLALGVFLLWFMVEVFRMSEPKVLSLPLLAAGSISLAFGGHVVSGQIRRAVLEAIDPIRRVRKALKGEDE